MSPLELYNYFSKSNSVSTDTRTLTKGDIYFALKGDNFDGNKFAELAIKKGASYAVVDDTSLNHPLFLNVRNCLESLQEIAKIHRSKLTKTKFIALTGSNGKTTTKELISNVLSSKFRVSSTIGNLNNHIGVPLTLLKTNQNTEIAVIEMGANHLKEIEFLTSMINPDYGLITNFGKAHLEGFGSIEGVIKGKSELYEFLAKKNKIAFINEDDEIQKKFDGNKVVYGKSKKLKYNFTKTNSGSYSTLTFKNHIIKSNLSGDYNYNNIAFATLIGLYFNIPIDEIKNSILTYNPDNNRSQILNRGNKCIVMDAYNANPSSMESAINSFKKRNGKKTVILGDMFELGKESELEHYKLIKKCIEEKIENIFLVGNEFFKHSNKFDSPIFFKNKKEFVLHFQNSKLKSDNILLKGSRGMKMEDLIEHL